MVLAAAEACEDKKAEDTRILELDLVDAGFTDFFLISSGSNERQTQAIADEIEMRLKKDFQTYPNSVEGRRQGEWILMDYVDFVVHIFLTEKRAYYDIERLRKSARTVDLEQLKAMLVKRQRWSAPNQRRRRSRRLSQRKPRRQPLPAASRLAQRRKPNEISFFLFPNHNRVAHPSRFLRRVG